MASSFEESILDEMSSSRRKILGIIEENWTEWAEEYCQDFKNGECSKTDNECKIIDCPKAEKYFQEGK